MLILVDGYNVTMRDPALALRSKEAQRDALLERVRALAPTLHGRGARAVVVFDAHDTWGHTSEDRGYARAVYATSADDEIVRRCSLAKGAVVVYTDDMRLRARISQDVGRHVEYRDVSALFAGTTGSRGGTTSGTVEREDALPRDAKDITAELEELWLDGEGE